MIDDLHAALKTEIVSTASNDGIDFRLVKLQASKIDVKYSLHVSPRSFSLSGLQTTDLLGYLGFVASKCAFFDNGKCYVIRVPDNFPFQDFPKAFKTAYESLQLASNDLEACGFSLEQPEGWTFFGGGKHHSRYDDTYGDGHTSPTTKIMKQAEDENFNFLMSWIENGDDKGWTFHYRPKQLPLSPELQVTFDFFKLKIFRECPHFDFEPCYWRFFRFKSAESDFFGSNAQYVHNYFDSHAQHFSLGIEHILDVHKVTVPFGFSFLDIHKINQAYVRTDIPLTLTSHHTVLVETDSVTTSKPAPVLTKKHPFEYDAALSFSGSDRAKADQLANAVKKAGYNVFYDDFYKAQLWGKDLVAHFDNVYRKQSRFCVIFVSREYNDKMWTNHERRSAQARALAEKGNEYILPIQVDDVELTGLPHTIGYLSLKEYTIDKIADILIEKLKI